MVISEQEVVIGEFYARKVRGHIIVRKITSIYGDDKHTWVNFITYGLVGEKNPKPSAATMDNFLKWIGWKTAGPNGDRIAASIGAS